MTQIRDTTEKGLKTRMNARVEQLGWTLARVAEETAEGYKNVQRWIRGPTAVPADFIARYVAAVPVDPVWLLTGEGTPDPVQAGEVERAFRAIAQIVDEVRGLPGPSVEPGAGETTGGPEGDTVGMQGAIDAARRAAAEAARKNRRGA